MTPDLRPTETGFLTLSSEAYHKTRGLSQGAIHGICRMTPLGWKAKASEPSSPAMDMGKVVEAIALDAGNYAVSPYEEFRTAEAKAWKARMLKNDTAIIKAEQFKIAEQAAAALSAVVDELTGGNYIAQQAYVWERETPFGPIPCKARADVWCPKKALIVDVKVTSNGIDDDAIDRFYTNYGGYLQSKFYRDGVAELIPALAGRVKFKTVFVEADAPFQVRVVESGGAYDKLADSQINYGAYHYAKGKYTGEWDGYPKEIRRMEPKPWALKDWLEDETNA